MDGTQRAAEVREEYFFHKPLRRLTLAVDFVEPAVDLIPLVAGSDGHLIRASMDSGAKGMVVEVFGRGNVPPEAMAAIEQARKKDVVVVFTTRTGGGRVVLDERSRRIGVISGQDLDGLKARVLLVVGLGNTRDVETLGSYYRQLSGEAESPAVN